jgi:hypothetical protein
VAVVATVLIERMLFCCTQLRILNLSNTGTDDAGLAVLLLSLRHLLRLKLTDCHALTAQATVAAVEAGAAGGSGLLDLDIGE